MTIRELAAPTLSSSASPSLDPCAQPDLETRLPLSAPSRSFRDLLDRHADDLDEQTPDPDASSSWATSTEPFVHQVRANVPPREHPHTHAVDQMFDEVVQALAVATDQRRRRVVMMRCRVGEHDVLARVRQCSTGVEIVLRSDDEGLRRAIADRAHELEERCRARGIEIAHLVS